MPTANGHYLLQQSAGTVAQAVISLVDGSNLLSETPMGEGRLYLFSTPLRPEYTDLVNQALFVPTIYNMALFSTPQPLPYHLLTATDPIPVGASSSTVSPRHVVNVIPSEPHTDFIPDIRRIGSRSYIIPHGEITYAGNFLLSPAPFEGLAFNYSRRESDLSCLSTSDIKQLLSDANLSNYSMTPSAAKSMTDYIRSRNQGTPLWRWCIVLALLALLAETLLIRLPRRNKKA